MIKKIVSLIVLAIVPIQVYGGALPAEVGQVNEEINRIQQQQQQQQEQERKELIKKRPQTTIEIDPVEKKVRPDDAVCRDVTDIKIEGAALLAESARKKLKAPYLNTCMTVTDIENLLGAITNYYIEKGYISARPYIQPQDLATGTLNILVIEGIVEEILLEDGKDNNSISLATAFPGLTGEPLNLRDIEQGLEQINRLASNNATMKIMPGDAVGTSSILIQNQSSRRLHLNLTSDNFGGSSTGQGQIGLNVALDNPLGLNDGLNYTHRRTTEHDFSSKHSRSNSLFYFIPYGYFTVTASHNWSDYVTTLSLPSGNKLKSNGTTLTSSLATNYLAYRDKFNRISINSKLTRKESKNYLAGQFLSVNSRVLSTFDLGASWTTRFLTGALGLNAGYSRGLSIWGALEDQSNLPDYAPRAQFTKWTTGFNWSKPFNIATQPFTFRTSFSAQAAKDVLYGSEQLSIGSIYSVRGYRDVSITGDRGYFMRNDLAMPMQVNIAGTPVLFRPYLGYDFGSIHHSQNAQGGRLSGGVIGASISSKHISTDITIVKPLSMPSRLKSSDEGVQVFGKVSLNF